MNSYLRDVYTDGGSNHRAALQGDAVNFNGVNQHFELLGTQVVSPSDGTEFTFFSCTRGRIIAYSQGYYGGGGGNGGGIGFVGTALVMESQDSPSTNPRTTLASNISALEYITSIVSINTATFPSDSFLCVDGTVKNRLVQIHGGYDGDYTATSLGDSSLLGCRRRNIGKVDFLNAAIKKIEIIKKSISKAEARRCYNDGTMANVAAPSDFILNLDGDNYNASTGIWTDTSPNAYSFTAFGSPTKSSFL